MAILNESVKPEFQNYILRLSKAADHLKGELLAVRAGRANPHILDKIAVDYWGTMTPLQQMANISVPEARVLVIAPYDSSGIKSISKAIMESDIGINPVDDGKVIRLVFPQLTEERRKDLIKQLKTTVENTKVILRNERRDAIEAVKRLKKDSLVTEDDVAFYEKEIQKELDKTIESVENMLKSKEKEILEI
jgi:ribosome recycling factor